MKVRTPGGAMLTFEDLRLFLEEDLGVDTRNVSSDTLLLSAGIIDSFALVSLMTFLEDKGGIRISPAEVNLDNMDSIGRMLAYVERVRR